jgi:Tautomerase enzyme
LIAKTGPLRTQAAGTICSRRHPLGHTENDDATFVLRSNQGRSEKQIDIILDATHEVLVKSFNVPERDRYQIVREHAPSRMIVEDTGLGIVRTPNMLVLQVTTRPRSKAMKQAFYRSLVEKLEATCGIAPSDVLVTFVTNTDEDWSFGLGRAHFLTGEL